MVRPVGNNQIKGECTECEMECQNESKVEYENCPCQANCPTGCPCPNYQCSNSTITTTTRSTAQTTTATTTDKSTTTATTTGITTSVTTKPTTTKAPMNEKDVLVLSTSLGQKQPMIISFDGKSYYEEIIN